MLDGYWHSLGTADTDGYSQSDPLTVTLSGGTTITYADFGYYRDPAGLGNWVWWDKNKDGIQDPDGVDNNSDNSDDETGIAGAIVTLTITWPNNGGTTTIQTTTDANGYYSFGNLLLDENMDGAGTGEPTFTDHGDEPGRLSAIRQHRAGSGGDRGLDSGLATARRSPSPRAASTTPTTSASIRRRWRWTWRSSAPISPADGVVITWETVSEQNNAGFNLYRAESAEGPWTRLNETLIAAQAPGSSEGRTYQWVDQPVVEAGVTLYYQLEDLALDGTATRHAPVEVALPAPNAVSLSGFAGSAGIPPALPGLALAAAVVGWFRRRKM